MQVQEGYNECSYKEIVCFLDIYYNKSLKIDMQEQNET